MRKKQIIGLIVLDFHFPYLDFFPSFAIACHPHFQMCSCHFSGTAFYNQTLNFILYLKVVFLSELSMGEQAVAALISILTSKETILNSPPSDTDLSENIISPSPAARILAEIKTRSEFKVRYHLCDAWKVLIVCQSEG